jgi:hypothetical protein
MRLHLGTFAVVAGAMATPAFAGAPVTPAPVAGIGIGAVVLVGLGYRALRRRIDR